MNFVTAISLYPISLHPNASIDTKWYWCHTFTQSLLHYTVLYINTSYDTILHCNTTPLSALSALCTILQFTALHCTVLTNGPKYDRFINCHIHCWLPLNSTYVYRTLYTEHLSCTLNTVHCLQYTIYFTLFLYNVHWTLVLYTNTNSVSCTLYIDHWVLFMYTEHLSCTLTLIL